VYSTLGPLSRFVVPFVSVSGPLSVSTLNGLPQLVISFGSLLRVTQAPLSALTQSSHEWLYSDLLSVRAYFLGTLIQELTYGPSQGLLSYLSLWLIGADPLANSIVIMWLLRDFLSADSCRVLSQGLTSILL
jgi:hypothetical protein